MNARRRRDTPVAFFMYELTGPKLGEAYHLAMLLNLSRRVLEPEIMDDPSLEPMLHHQALRGLARVHRVSGTARTLERCILNMAGDRGGEPLRIMDLACGGGDLIVSLTRRARAAGRPWRIDGCDKSATALAYARAQLDGHGIEADLMVRDVLHDGLPAGYDVVINSLFLHHLSDQQTTCLLGDLRGAAPMLAIYDLLRSRRSWLLTWIGVRVLSRSPVVHRDGPQSVRAAYTFEEITRLAHVAGLKGARVRCCWPDRFVLGWKADT